MLDRLKGVTDPEAKRKAIGGEFIAAFRKFKDDLQANKGVSPNFLVQVSVWIRFYFPKLSMLSAVRDVEAVKSQCNRTLRLVVVSIYRASD